MPAYLKFHNVFSFFAYTYAPSPVLVSSLTPFFLGVGGGNSRLKSNINNRPRWQQIVAYYPNFVVKLLWNCYAHNATKKDVITCRTSISLFS